MADDRTPEHAPHPSGLFASLKTLLATLIALGHNRLELFGTELQEEIARAAAVLLWALAALLLGMLALFLGALAILLAVPEDARVHTLVILAICAAAAGVLAGLVGRSRAAAKPRAFDATLGELAKDREQLSR